MEQTRYGVLVKRDDLVEIFSDFNERLSAGDFGQAEFYPDVADALVFRFDQRHSKSSKHISRVQWKGHALLERQRQLGRRLPACPSFLRLRMKERKKKRIKVKVLKNSIQVSIDVTDVLKQALREIRQES